MDDDNVVGDGLANRAVTVTNIGELGRVMTVNEGSHAMDSNVWYLKVTGENSCETIRREKVMQEILKDHPKELARYYEQVKPKISRDEGVPPRPDAPEWVQGVVDEENLEDDDFKLEFEYLAGNTAIARRLVRDIKEDTEEWILYMGEKFMLSSKIELKDRYQDMNWEKFGKGSAVLGFEERDMNMDEAEEDRYHHLVVKDFSVDISSKSSVDEEYIKESLPGLYPRLDVDGGNVGVSFHLERLREGGVFRMVVNNDVFYYWFEDGEVDLPVSIPEWAVSIYMSDAVEDAV